MKVLVVGAGGREHALVWKIRQSSRVSRVYCQPGNGGTVCEGAVSSPLLQGTDGLADFVKREGIDLTVVGPELPLSQGIVDRFEAKQLAIIGPNVAAARLEGSKIFAKEFMARHGIPTASYSQASSPEEASAILRTGRFGCPLVIKADGLAAGKGVIIADNLAEAELAIQQFMRERVLGHAGEQVIIEEFLQGEEISFLVFSDGIHVLPMVPSQDHKRVFDNDAGPNTGGMGAYSTDWLLDPSQTREVIQGIVVPTIEGMAAEGSPYRGILYVGLILTPSGAKVLEFNVRMGDPETQPVLFRMQNDIMDVFEGLVQKRLDRVQLKWDSGCSICVVLASGGYPGTCQTGKLVSGIPEAERLENVKVFHAGTEWRDNQWFSTGGRVLGVTAKAPTLQSTIDLVYHAVSKIHFENMHYRRDIGRKGLGKEAQSQTGPPKTRQEATCPDPARARSSAAVQDGGPDGRVVSKS